MRRMKSIGVLFFGTDDTYPLPWYLSIPLRGVSQQLIRTTPPSAVLRRLGMQLQLLQGAAGYFLSGFAPVVSASSAPTYVQPLNVVTVPAGQTQSINLSTGWVAVVYARSFTSNTSIVVNGQVVNLNQDPDGDGVYEVALAFVADVGNETLVVTNNNANVCRVYVFNNVSPEFHTITVGNSSFVYPFLPRITVNPLYSVFTGVPGYQFVMGGAVSSVSALVTGWSPSAPPNVIVVQNTIVTRPQGGTIYVLFTVFNGNTSAITVSGTLVDQSGNTLATSSANVGATSTSVVVLSFTPPSGYVLPNIGAFTLNLSVTVGTSSYTTSVPVIINQTDLLRLDIVESLLGITSLPITIPSTFSNLCFITHAAINVAPTNVSVCAGSALNIQLTVAVNPDIANLLPSSGATVNIYAIGYELTSSGAVTYLGVSTVGSATLSSTQPSANVTYSFTPSDANAIYLLGFYATLSITSSAGTLCLAAAPLGIANTLSLVTWPPGWTPFAQNLFIAYPPSLAQVYSQSCIYPYQVPTPVVTPITLPQFTGKLEFHDVHLIVPEVAIISPSTLQGSIFAVLVNRSKVPAQATISVFAVLPSGVVPLNQSPVQLSALPGAPPATATVNLTVPSNAASGTCLTTTPCMVPGFIIASITVGWATRVHTYPIMIVTAGSPLPRFRPFS